MKAAPLRSSHWLTASKRTSVFAYSTASGCPGVMRTCVSAPFVSTASPDATGASGEIARATAVALITSASRVG